MKFSLHSKLPYGVNCDKSRELCLWHVNCNAERCVVEILAITTAKPPLDENNECLLACLYLTAHITVSKRSKLKKRKKRH